MPEVKIDIKKYVFEGNLPDYCIQAQYKQHTLYRIEHDEEKTNETAEQLRTTLLNMETPVQTKEK